jgi:hypothetical protein
MRAKIPAFGCGRKRLNNQRRGPTDASAKKEIRRAAWWAWQVMAGTSERCFQVVAFSRGRDDFPTAEAQAQEKISLPSGALKM